MNDIKELACYVMLLLAISFFCVLMGLLTGEV